MLLASALRRGDAQGLERSVREAIDYIGTEIDNLRTLITELRQAALDEIGLAPAIESLGQRLGVVEGLDVQIEVEVGGRLEPELETTVYRVVQEALTNIAKQAHAESVQIRVGLDFDVVRVEVRDDGRGFDPGGPRRRVRPGRHARARGARTRSARDRLRRRADRCARHAAVGSAARGG